MNLTSTHLLAISPLIIVGLTVMVVMLAVAWRRCHAATAALTLLGLGAALAATLWLAIGNVLPGGDHPLLMVTPLVQIDLYSLIFTGMVLIGGMGCTLLGKTYFDRFNDHREEYYLLLACSVMGAMLLVSSVHLASMFVGLELMSVALYGMTAYAYRQRVSLEAGIKYMVLSAVATAFLLFGMALLYAACGTLSFAELGHHFGHVGGHWVSIGVAMMVIGLGFKLSIVPFHLWTPDVYEGAPMPVTAFLATVSKVGVFAALLRFFMVAPIDRDMLYTIMAVMGVLSMVGGNLLALRQHNLKRIMGYSSIAHLGYLMTVIVALQYGGDQHISSAEAAILYLFTYMLTSLGAFAIMTLVSCPWEGHDAGNLYHYRGLFWRHPYQAAGMSLMMISMAGIPLTAGFVGKFYIASVGVDVRLWWMVGALVLGSAIGLYYYLRVMITLFLSERNEEGYTTGTLKGSSCALAMAFIVTTVVWLIGLYPAPLIDLVHASL